MLFFRRFTLAAFYIISFLIFAACTGPGVSMPVQTTGPVMGNATFLPGDQLPIVHHGSGYGTALIPGAVVMPPPPPVVTFEGITN